MRCRAESRGRFALPSLEPSGSRRPLQIHCNERHDISKPNLTVSTKAWQFAPSRILPGRRVIWPKPAILSRKSWLPANSKRQRNFSQIIRPRSVHLSPGKRRLCCIAIIRNLRPDHVFEIGSYKAGTTEALCRALQANGHGLLHTVDPFRGDYIAATIAHWPTELQFGMSAFIP